MNMTKLMIMTKKNAHSVFDNILLALWSPSLSLLFSPYHNEYAKEIKRLINIFRAGEAAAAAAASELWGAGGSA